MDEKTNQPPAAKTGTQSTTPIRGAFESLKKLEVYFGFYRGIRFDIKMQVGEPERFPYRNYYVYLPEGKVADFERIWLADEIKSFPASGREYVSHDYYQSPLGPVDMHGGITYYAKHGHSIGHRCVEIGCDYSHLHDDGQDYTAKDLFFDVCTTIDDCYERGLLKPEIEAIP